ncbi:hypothetical protein BIW53_20060 [Pseudoalteromonas byunsanensis]|uniref:Uncharacterized protein n=1 Tax=Pseudoalteromonas byunsanensis TaxID=327939 RepID=A0A1S1N2G4_9GAMM|nr:hypothetical protein BIW53_20060 [Pseudoalteromonas byunsanensis]
MFIVIPHNIKFKNQHRLTDEASLYSYYKIKIIVFRSFHSLFKNESQSDRNSAISIKTSIAALFTLTALIFRD